MPAPPAPEAVLRSLHLLLVSLLALLEAEPLSPVPDCEPLEGKGKLFITPVSPSPGTLPGPSPAKKCLLSEGVRK